MRGWTPCPRACSAGWGRPTRSCSGWPPCSAPACSPSGARPRPPPGPGCRWPSCSAGVVALCNAAVDGRPRRGLPGERRRVRLRPGAARARPTGRLAGVALPGRQGGLGGRGGRRCSAATCCPSRPVPAAVGLVVVVHRAEHRGRALDGARARTRWSAARSASCCSWWSWSGSSGPAAGRRRLGGRAGGRAGRRRRGGCPACSPRPGWCSSPSPATRGSPRSARRCATRTHAAPGHRLIAWAWRW